MTRRIQAILSLLLLVILGAGAPAAMAQGGDDPVGASTAYNDDWACVAVQTIEVGACVENPLEPLSDQGGVLGIVQGLAP